MPENQQPDWRAIALARGIPLRDAVLRSLETLERDFAQVRAGLTLFDEPISQPRMDEPEMPK